MRIPEFRDVLEAQRRISPYLSKTPLYSYPAINELLGTEVYIKHENYQPVGAFKVRGGINLISQLPEDLKQRGVIAASTGNHGQSVAYASRLFGAKAIIVVPEKANPGKVAAMKGMGAEVIFHGAHYDEAKTYCEQLAKEHGYRYIHSGDEPDLIAGVGTYALEMLHQEPDLNVIFVPVGGGSGAAGVCIVTKAIDPQIKVIGVQSEASPAAYNSWKQKQLVEAPNRTFAEGLAAGVAFSLPQKVLWDHLDDFILVSDNELRQAMVWMIERAHTLAEGAGAAALAAAFKIRPQLHSKKVGLVCSGGNTSLANLNMAINTVNC
ncbi:MAG: threonine/serine dehydratase [Candidatus Heimdallarchaeota archaeon]